jgi:hypothetical protein
MMIIIIMIRVVVGVPGSAAGETVAEEGPSVSTGL